MNVNMKKLELEKNEFIRKLSREQFDAVMTNKYKQVFVDYFGGKIDDDSLFKKMDDNNQLIHIYENGDNGKIDSNQYLYSSIVEVALHYFNQSNQSTVVLNKLSLLASYHQLVVFASENLKMLCDYIGDIFFLNRLDNDDASKYMNKKLKSMNGCVESLQDAILNIHEHEQIIQDVESKTNTNFCDEPLIDESIRELYRHCKESSSDTQTIFDDILDNCKDYESNAKLNVLKCKLC